MTNSVIFEKINGALRRGYAESIKEKKMSNSRRGQEAVLSHHTGENDDDAHFENSSDENGQLDKQSGGLDDLLSF